MPVKRVARNTFELKEAVIRLAEIIAERYGVTVQELFEASFSAAQNRNQTREQRGPHHSHSRRGACRGAAQTHAG
jgi:hypothetical protein